MLRWEAKYCTTDCITFSLWICYEIQLTNTNIKLSNTSRLSKTTDPRGEWLSVQVQVTTPDCKNAVSSCQLSIITGYWMLMWHVQDPSPISIPNPISTKMIDIWLIFNLLLPFIEVLVHTYMDTLRWVILQTEKSKSKDWEIIDFIEKQEYKMQNFKTKNRNDEDREINHHGRPVEVGEDESRPGSTNKVGAQYYWKPLK